MERGQAPQDCQPILIDPAACKTCPLNPYQGKEPPEISGFIQHILLLDEYMQAGVSFEFDALQRIEWRGLALLKYKRNEKQIKDMKRK